MERSISLSSIHIPADTRRQEASRTKEQFANSPTQQRHPDRYNGRRLRRNDHSHALDLADVRGGSEGSPPVPSSAIRSPTR
jgi:hypothetical protein